MNPAGTQGIVTIFPFPLYYFNPSGSMLGSRSCGKSRGVFATLQKRESAELILGKNNPILHAWSINQVTDQCARTAADCSSSTGKNFFIPLRKIVTAPPPGTRSFIVPSIVSSLPRCSMNEKELARLAQQREGCKAPQKEAHYVCLHIFARNYIISLTS